MRFSYTQMKMNFRNGFCKTISKSLRIKGLKCKQKKQNSCEVMSLFRSTTRQSTLESQKFVGLLTLFQKFIFCPIYFDEKVTFFGCFMSQNLDFSHDQTLFRVTFFRQIRVGWTLQISKIQSKFWTKIGLLT